ncbi:hypothetical protein ACG0Z4_28735 [Enterocloster aldenensis]|uniref:hypothetical protein n=1 Tax=Enterocloster aldenensis TaxID=358742 RepID=UPI004025605E
MLQVDGRTWSMFSNKKEFNMNETIFSKKAWSVLLPPTSWMVCITYGKSGDSLTGTVTKVGKTIPPDQAADLAGTGWPKVCLAAGGFFAGLV